MAHRRSGRTFHKKVMKQRAEKEAQAIKDNVQPVVVTKLDPAEVAAMIEVSRRKK